MTKYASTSRWQYIKGIQMFLLNMAYISRVKCKIFIVHDFVSGETNIEMYIFFTSRV